MIMDSSLSLKSLEQQRDLSSSLKSRQVRVGVVEGRVPVIVMEVDLRCMGREFCISVAKGTEKRAKLMISFFDFGFLGVCGVCIGKLKNLEIDRYSIDL